MNSSASPIFTVNPDPEEIFFGIAYALVSLFLLPLYTVVMVTLYTKDCQKANMTYKLMNLINFFEVGQAICHLVSSPILVFPVMQVRFDTLIRVFACTINTFWVAELPLMTILAVSRIMIFCGHFRADRMHIATALLLVLSWILFVLLFGCITGNVTFLPPSWGYDEEILYAETFQQLELVLSFPSLAVSCICYIVMFYIIHVRKKKSSSVSSRKTEVAILIQYTFVTIYMTVLIILWHKGYVWFDMKNPRLQAIINVSWIACAYLSPVMLLILNRSIRLECQRILGFESKRKTSKNRQTTSVWSNA